MDARNKWWLMLKNNDNRAAYQHPRAFVQRGRAGLISDTSYPLSFLSAMWNYKPVKVRTSSYSTSKDKWWGEGIPQQGSVSPSPATLPTKNPRGRRSKDQIIVPFPPQLHPFNPDFSLALEYFEANTKLCQFKTTELTGLQLGQSDIYTFTFCKRLK